LILNKIGHVLFLPHIVPTIFANPAYQLLTVIGGEIRERILYECAVIPIEPIIFVNPNLIGATAEWARSDDANFLIIDTHFRKSPFFILEQVYHDFEILSTFVLRPIGSK
jgi:hypothetical protein